MILPDDVKAELTAERARLDEDRKRSAERIAVIDKQLAADRVCRFAEVTLRADAIEAERADRKAKRAELEVEAVVGLPAREARDRRKAEEAAMPDPRLPRNDE